MSIVDDLRSLDTNDPGRWPLPIRIAAIALVFVGVMAFGVYMFVIQSEMPALDDAKRVEMDPAELCGEPRTGPSARKVCNLRIRGDVEWRAGYVPQEHTPPLPDPTVCRKQESG